MNISIGMTLKNLRKQNKYTRQQVAQYLNIDQCSIEQIERGDRSIELNILKRLCNLYGYDISVVSNGSLKDYNPIILVANDSLKNEKDMGVIAKMKKLAINMRFIQNLLGE